MSGSRKTLHEEWQGATVFVSPTKKQKPSASAQTTSLRRAGHRLFGGTATDPGGKAVAPKRCWGAAETLDLSAIRYRDFQRKAQGGSRTNNPKKPHDQRAEEGPTCHSLT